MTRPLLLIAVMVAGALLTLDGCSTAPSGTATPTPCVSLSSVGSDGHAMPRERMYSLLDAARADTGPASPSADATALREVLGECDPSAVSGFVVAFDDELIRLNRWSVWGAGYVANGGMGDDDFHYFRSWLIGKGREAVDAVLKDPDALADYLDGGDLENEALEYVALDLLEAEGLPDPRDEPNRASADDEPAGRPFDERDVAATYSRTAAATD